MMYGGVSACVRVSAAYRPCTLPAVAIIFMIDAFAFYPFRSIQTANTYWSSLLQTWLMQILLVFSELNISSYAGFLFSESLSNGFALGHVSFIQAEWTYGHYYFYVQVEVQNTFALPPVFILLKFSLNQLQFSLKWARESACKEGLALPERLFGWSLCTLGLLTSWWNNWMIQGPLMFVEVFCSVLLLSRI